MQLGIFAKTFPEKTALNSLQAVKASGFCVAHFNTACCGMASMPEEVPPHISGEIREAALASGVPLLGLSATFNLIDPDHQKRGNSLYSFKQLAQLARAMNVPMLSICTGTCDENDMWKHHPNNANAESWRDMCRELAKLVAVAEEYGLKIGVEPEHSNVVSSAKIAKQLLKEMQSSALSIILDPANLLNSETGKEQHYIVAQAVDILAPHIAMAHAKDKNKSGQNVVAGTGIVDFPFFLSQLRSQHFNGPLVTHGLESQDAPHAAKYLKGLMQ